MKFTLFVILLILSVGGFCAGCTSRSASPAAPTAQEARSSSTIALTSLRLDDTTRRALDVVGGDLARARVVLLGEPDHYIHEKYAYDLMFVRWLVERGYRQIGFEMGRAQAKRFDEFVATGDESALRASPEETRDADEAKGILKADRGAGWMSLDSKERIAFFRALRAIDQARPKGTPRLRVFGFDVDFHPAIAYRHVLDLLRSGTSDAVRDLRAQLKYQGADDELVHLTEARRLADAYAAALTAELGAELARELPSALRELDATVRFTRVAFHDPSLDALFAAYAERERTMFWQVDEATGGPDHAEPTILIGHNMHLGRESASIRFGDIENGRQMWPSIGSYVASRYGAKAYAVWLLYSGGTHGGHGCHSPACPIEAPAATVEAELAKRGACYLLPVRGSVRTELDVDLRFIQNGDLGSGRLARQVDLLVYVNTVRGPDEAGAAELLRD